MTREELLKSQEYWLAQIQQDLYGMMEDYRIKNNFKRKDLAEFLGVTKGYISQILKGDFDHKISKLVELSLAFNKAPIITYKDIDDYIKDDSINENIVHVQRASSIQYILSVDTQKAELDPSTFRELQNLETASTAKIGTTPSISDKELCYG